MYLCMEKYIVQYKVQTFFVMQKCLWDPNLPVNVYIRSHICPSLPDFVNLRESLICKRALDIYVNSVYVYPSIEV